MRTGMSASQSARAVRNSENSEMDVSNCFSRILDARSLALESVDFPCSSMSISSIHGHCSAIGRVYSGTSAVTLQSGYCFLSKAKAGQASMKSPNLSLRSTIIFFMAW